MQRMNARQLRKIPSAQSRSISQTIPRRQISLILDNVWDTYNVGGLFRLADALGVEMMYLCHDTQTPPNNRIHKASCGTYKVVPWQYHASATDAIAQFRARYELSPSAHPHSCHVMGVEQSARSVPYQLAQYETPLALVLGNETTGITPEALAQCDTLVEIPMWGVNLSLNVIVSAAIVAYHLTMRHETRNV